MKTLARTAFVCALAAVLLAGPPPGQVPPGRETRNLSVLVLLGEWFGDAYFPLAKEIEARGWTMKRVGIDAEYRGCYNKERDIVLRSDILIPDLKDFSGYDALIIPSGPQWRKFNEDPAVLAFIRNAHAAGLIIASFCVGNTTVKAAGLVDLPAGPGLYPEKVMLVMERVLLGPRGGGPPPGDGFESAPIKEICDAVVRQRTGGASRQPPLFNPYLGQKPPGMTPEVFAPGIVSKQGDQGRLFIAGDGSEIIYGEREPGGRMRILSILQKGGVWSPPEVLPFSEEYINNEPCLAPDGKRLFFVSNRPRAGIGEAEKFPDIWVAEKSAGTWGEPKNLGDPVNRLDVAVQPFLAADGRLYFGGQAADGSSRGLYVSRDNGGVFSEPEMLDPGIFDRQVSGPCLSPDGRVLVVHARNDGGFGNWDLYASFRGAAGEWGPLVNLGKAVNTEAAEAGASFSPDGGYLFFSRAGDIYWVSAEVIDDVRPREGEKAVIEKVIRDNIGWALTKDRPLAESTMVHDESLFIFNPTSEPTIGWSQLVKNFDFWLDPRFKATTCEIWDMRIGVARSGDVAWWSCMLNDLAEWDGKPTGWKDTRWTGVLEKRDGTWVIVQMHFSFASDKVAAQVKAKLEAERTDPKKK